MTDYSEAIEKLRVETNTYEGLLVQARSGRFDPAQGEEFLRTLRAIPQPDGDYIDWLLVSYIWKLPLFLFGQEERVAKISGNLPAYQRFSERVLDEVQRILTSPKSLTPLKDLPPPP